MGGRGFYILGPLNTYMYLRNRKHALCLYRVIEKRVSGSLGEREMLWEHELQFSQTFTSVSIKQLDYELKISIA